ncbi:MAG: thiamine biosynthesis protein [Leptospirillia bacterium]
MSNKKENGHKTPKAIALVSGGLDSTLAVRLMQEQGVEVSGVHFYTGFCITEQQRRVGNPKAKNKPNDGLKAGSDLGIPVEIVDISKEYLEIVTHPKHGYGANVNPCVDCRAMMIKRAGEIMQEQGADFVITGEVLGQRPMSQNRRAMDIIEGEADLGGRLVRPLSAKNLPTTVPEREGLIDRDRLKSFSGRTRKPQLALAQELDVEEFLQPAGGCCFLTDESFARKFRDLFAHAPDTQLDHDQIMLLTVGRHFRLPNGAKVVVGRNQAENGMIVDLVTRRAVPEGRLMVTEGVKGPMTMVAGAHEDDLMLAARITSRYADVEPDVRVEVRYWNPADEDQSDGRCFSVVTPDPFAFESCRV